MTFHLSWRASGARLLAAALLAAALLAPALAHEGHDHGDEPPAAALPALAPRTEASSDLFELLVVLDAAQLTLWLDRFGTSEPLPGARVEVEGQGWKALATAAADGSLRVALPRPLAPGAHALVFTVQTGADNDLLDASLVLPPSPAAAPAQGLLSTLGRWLGSSRLADGASRGATRPATPDSATERAQRLPDGRVFLPKLAQRRLALRTLVTELKTLPRSVELVGEVVLDPNAAGRVQASQAGRLTPGPRGLPVPGQRVTRGQVQALVQPTPGAAESASRAAELADLDVKAALVERQLARARELAATVPRKEAESLAAELDRLRQRRAALSTATKPEPLLAPVAGVVASARATAGQMVEPRELLFEIVDPQRLLVEALVHDVALAASLQRASLADSGTPLLKLGVAGAMRDAALPVLFRPQGGAALALHQPVRLLAQSSQTLTGVALPAAAVVRNPSNEPSVWLHERAELFRPVPVQVQPLDGRTVVVTGVAAGARVVTDGATLLNQVR